MKILLCFGTRPEAIKMAPIIHELKNCSIEFKVCITAQHREMLDQVLEFFAIIPDYDLNLMQPGQSLNSLAALILSRIDEVLDIYKPDIVLVQGDTTTAFMVSMATFNRQIKVGHIEAGLRTQNLGSPFPEEGNRQLISRIAHIHFAPTLSAKNNLLKEAISEDSIFVTGNTVIDSLFIAKSKLEEGYRNEEIKELQSIREKNKKLILVTGHRRENFGEGLDNICRALLEISKQKDVQIIFPVHLNPEVKTVVYRILGSNPNIYLFGPIQYPAFVWLMMQADLIISDSGGIQEEAPSLKKPVLITRDNTERPEAVEAGFCFLVGTNKQILVQEANHLLDHPPVYTNTRNPFGDGFASQRIIQALTENDV